MEEQDSSLQQEVSTQLTHAGKANPFSYTLLLISHVNLPVILFLNIFIYLAASSLSCGTRDLCWGTRA